MGVKLNQHWNVVYVECICMYVQELNEIILKFTLIRELWLRIVFVYFRKFTY